MSTEFPPLPNRVVINNDLDSAREIQDQILAEAKAMGYSQKCRFGARLAMEEAISNAYRHGNRRDKSKRITISYEVTPEKMIVRVADEGPGFDPGHLPDPTSEDRLSCPDGRGVMLMRSFSDTVLFNRSGNEVELVKHRS